MRRSTCNYSNETPCNLWNIPEGTRKTTYPTNTLLRLNTMNRRSFRSDTETERRTIVSIWKVLTFFLDTHNNKRNTEFFSTPGPSPAHQNSRFAPKTAKPVIPKQSLHTNLTVSHPFTNRSDTSHNR